MASKAKRAYVCNDCGADFPRWQGQCNACGAWNTITEVRLAASPQVARNERLSGYAGSVSDAQVQNLSEIDLQEVPRFSTGFKEFDRVLGGGIVPGAAVLIGGNPGLVKVPCSFRQCVDWPLRCRLYMSPVKSHFSKLPCELLV